MSRNIDTSGKTSMSEEQLTSRQGGKLIFTTYHEQKTALLIRDDRLKAACFFPREQSKIGAVYICKVKNAVKNLNAYFVEIGGTEREICFLSQKDAAYPFLLNRAYDGRILEGDEFPVQVIRDAAKTKQASVTTLISLSNSYFALNVGEEKTGISNKLSPKEKDGLREFLTAQSYEPPRIAMPLQPTKGRETLPIGLVIRTRAAELFGTMAAAQSEETMVLHLQEHLQELLNRLEGLFQAAVHRTCFSCLMEAPLPWESALEQLAYPYEYEEILTDDDDLYQELAASDAVPADKKIRLYDEKQRTQLSLTKLYSLETKLDTALNRRVWLKSGGYLVIDPTEALTVIDVNSGKYENGKVPEDTFYRINREAAEEIALQLRLRNLSGMILIDFINMKSKERQAELMEYLRSLVRRDKQKTVVVDMTALGLVEITRKKSSKPLAEQLEKKGKKSEPQNAIGRKELWA